MGNKKKKYQYRFGDLTLMAIEGLFIGLTLGVLDAVLTPGKKRAKIRDRT